MVVYPLLSFTSNPVFSLGFGRIYKWSNTIKYLLNSCYKLQSSLYYNREGYKAGKHFYDEHTLVSLQLLLAHVHARRKSVKPINLDTRLALNPTSGLLNRESRA